LTVKDEQDLVYDRMNKSCNLPNDFDKKERGKIWGDADREDEVA